jgi:hypothetical protein
MSNLLPSDPVEQASALQHAKELIARATSQFPISQIVVPFADVIDLFMDDVSTERYWLDSLQSLRSRFAPRWEVVAQRALGENPRWVSDQALSNPDFDPLAGAAPWGSELTRAFRAVFSELEEFADDAPNVFPTDKRTRAFVRGVRTQTGRMILPVLSYVPFQESEWRAIIDKLDDLIDLALRFEGAVVVWLIGGFARDVEGRLQLRPQVSFEPPGSGIRVKPLHVLLGTDYTEQCPSLIPLVRSVTGARPRPSDALLADTPWHRLFVQLDVTVDDYVLLNLNRMGQAEREIAERIVYSNELPQPHALEGTVARVPRPWGHAEPIPQPPEEPVTPASETTLLPPRPALEAASQPSAPAGPVTPPDAASLRQDAERLRRKGMAAVKTDPAIAQKYLLASTILENNSVDVWLTLVNIAINDKQRESFRREAEKVLRRQRRNA